MNESPHQVQVENPVGYSTLAVDAELSPKWTSLLPNWRSHEQKDCLTEGFVPHLR